MLRTVIFDFDLTLFDSSLLKTHMQKREWALVYRNIPNCSFYPNSIETINKLREKNITVAIVSNSPRTYVTKVLEYYNINVDYIVCYHDVSQHKPNPEGVFKVLNHFFITTEEAIYIGDNDIDYYTAYNAQVQFLGVPWGIFSKSTNKISTYQDLLSSY